MHIGAMRTLSIAEASRLGVAGLSSSLESGERIALSRHGRIVAELVTAREMNRLREEQEMLRDAALVMARLAVDSGGRAELDQVMRAFGLSRADLEAEIATDNYSL